jgi:hypothetical protein
VQIIIPVGCQIFRRTPRIETDIPIGLLVVERMLQRKSDGLYTCSIVSRIENEFQPVTLVVSISCHFVLSFGIVLFY